MSGAVASAVLACLIGAASPAANALPVDPNAAEALLRAELANFGGASDICVSVDGAPLAAAVAQRLQNLRSRVVPDSGTCPTRISISDFTYRPQLGTYEVRFASQLFGGSNVAVMKHFTAGPAPGWHVVTTYHVGVWL